MTDLFKEKTDIAHRLSEEIRSYTPTKSCCQKAYLCGLLFSCRRNTQGRGYIAFFRSRVDAENAAKIIDSRFSGGTQTLISDAARGGHKGYSVPFFSKALFSVFSEIDSNVIKDANELIGFKCGECEQYFMRGVTLSCGMASQPQNGYRLEFSFDSEVRATLIEKLLISSGFTPNRAVRNKKNVLYYRKNEKICDILHSIGASGTAFEITDMSIERNIRNNENRATNCVTSNIMRSVEATRKHIDAIQYLIDEKKMALLDDDLAVTARLRIENDSASLSELAALHNPPITKSGVNGRLNKILKIAEEIKND